MMQSQPNLYSVVGDKKRKKTKIFAHVQIHQHVHNKMRSTPHDSYSSGGLKLVTWS